MTIRYSVDTSSIVAAWVERYPQDMFPSFWVRFADLARDGTIGCIDEVERELSVKDDDLHKWVKKADGLIHPIDDDVQYTTLDILSDPERARLVNSVPGRSKGDPFVIALAVVHGCCVVTEEESATSKIKIPDVCRLVGVECLGLLAFMRRERFSFG